jgi:hypothetical protein
MLVNSRFDVTPHEGGRIQMPADSIIIDVLP